jgi:multidrug efflux pump subunit AcrA (membrane-fusion protein)
VQSAMPWFVGGLALVVVLGGAGWAGLRLFGDAILGPAPTTLAQAPKDPIALEREAEEAKAKKADEAASGNEEAAPAAATDDPDEPPADDDEPPPDDGDEPSAPAGEDAPAEPDDGQASGEEGGARVAAAEASPPPVTTRRPPTTAKPPAEGVGEGEAGAASTAPRAWYPVVVEREAPLSVRTRAGGTVASVAVSDGQVVRKGELLFSFEDAGGSDEIANLRANIEALEAVAESQPSAQEMLEREREKLRRLLAASGDVNVTAPAAGTLSGFSVKVGDVLKAGESVGVVERGGATLLVNVPASEGRRLKKGSPVELRTANGSETGRVAIVKRRGAGYQVVLSTDGNPNDVREARF